MHSYFQDTTLARLASQTQSSSARHRPSRFDHFNRRRFLWSVVCEVQRLRLDSSL